MLLLGGAYLIYKGIRELTDVLALTEIKAETSEEHKARHLIGLPQAVGTIMVMDLVFSIDSVITAVGMADHQIIMIIAVIISPVTVNIFDFIKTSENLFSPTAVGIYLNCPHAHSASHQNALPVRQSSTIPQSAQHIRKMPKTLLIKRLLSNQSAFFRASAVGIYI